MWEVLSVWNDMRRTTAASGGERDREQPVLMTLLNDGEKSWIYSSKRNDMLYVLSIENHCDDSLTPSYLMWLW